MRPRNVSVSVSVSVSVRRAYGINVAVEDGILLAILRVGTRPARDGKRGKRE